MSLPNERNIREWLAEELNENLSNVTVYGVKLSRAYSQVYRAIAPALPHGVAVKVCIDPDTSLPSKRSAATQFAALNKAANASGPPCRVPQAYDLLVERGCLVTEWFDAEPLDERWRIGKRKSEIVDECIKAAKWLQNLHQRGYIGRGHLDTGLLLATLSAELDKTPLEFQQSRAVRDGLSALLATRHKADLDDVAISWIHGDFKPANILVSGTEIVGIDLALHTTNVVLPDIRSFLLELHLMAMEPKNITMFAMEQSLEEAFLAEYFNGRPPFAARWSKLYLALSAWAAREDGTRRGPKKLFLCARLKRVVCRDTAQMTVSA